MFLAPGLDRIQERLAIRNHGPSAATDIELVELSGQGGVERDWASASVNDVLPVRILQPLQDHHVIMEWSVGDPRVAEAVVRWADGSGQREEDSRSAPTTSDRAAISS